MSQTKTDSNFGKPYFDIPKAIFQGDIATVRAALASDIQRLNVADRWSRQTPLQIAVGSDQLAIARYLVQLGARFTPDPEGRMPSILACECMVSDEMCDFIVDAEAAALVREPD